MTPRDDGWRRLLHIWRRTPAHEVDAELAFHFDERIAELHASGVDPDVARAQAAREFGDVMRVRTDLVSIDRRIDRVARGRDRWEWMLQDLRHALRSIAKAPGFFVAVSLTLMLGIGANAAMFSVLDRMYLAAPPGVVHPEQLHRLSWIPKLAPGRDAPTVNSVLGYPEFRALAAALPAGVDLAGYDSDPAQLGDGDDIVPITAVHVIGNYFRVVGATPVTGRFFSPGELRLETPLPVAVISSRLWAGRFGGRSDIVGHVITVDGFRYTIIGVIRGAFHGADADAGDIWLPMSALGQQRGGGKDWYEGTAWIQPLLRWTAPNIAPAVIHAATAAIRGVAEFPGAHDETARIDPLVEASLPGFPAPGVAIARRLAMVAIIILLVTCANVVNLFLARSVARRREIAVRLALGVPRHRLIGMLLLEVIIAAVVGGVLASGVAMVGAPLLRRALLPDVHWTDPALNLQVLTFTLGVALITGVGVGLISAMRAVRPGLSASLQGGARQGVYQASRLRSSLVIAQTALSVVLLVCAGLVIRSLRSVEAIDTGYDSARVVYASVRADPAHRSRRAEIPARLFAIASQIRALPGVHAAALVAGVPMYSMSFMQFRLPGHDSLPRVAADGPFASFVSPEYFATVGIPVLRGGLFRADDRFGSAAVSVVVNQALAQAYWGRTDVVGECVVLAEQPANGCARIVGVVANEHAEHIVEARPAMELYLPPADSGFGSPYVIAIRTDPALRTTVAADIRRDLAGEFAGWATPTVRTMTDYLAPELRPWRVGASLFTVAGVLALVVAMVGIYSSLAYMFRQRTHELGVRVALGADASTIARLVIGQAVRIVAVGVMLGIVLALACGRIMTALLYRTSSRDPWILAGVSTALLVIAMLAAAVPAWRASRVDPVIALRAE